MTGHFIGKFNNEADMPHDVFISYSSIDKNAADNVCSILEKNGISCWIAPRNITPGVPFAEAIIDGIKSSKVFVLVYSANSNNSSQVIREVDRAVNHGLAIINLRLEDVPLSKQLEYYVSSVHWLDAVTPPLDKHLHQLCQVVQIFLKPAELKEAEIAEAFRKGIIKRNEPDGNEIESRIAKKRRIVVSGILLAVVITIASLIVFNIGGIKQARAGSIESMVVLPFDNFTGDEQLDYVAAGMHASLVGDMGKVGALRVIGETSSSIYKNTDKSARDIARELNVDALVEPTLTSYGDTICIQIRLITPFPEEKQIWVADYREDKRKIQSLWNQVVKQISGELKVELTPEQERLLSKSIIVDREAYDAYVRSYQYWSDLSQESLNKALEYLNLAVEKDPDFAPSFAGLAQVWVGLAQMGFAPPDVAGPKIFENINIALELDPDFATSHFVSGIIAVWTEWDWEKGEREFKKALEINPNDAMTRIYYSHLLLILKRYDEALFHSQMAAELDPMNPLVLGLSAMVDYDFNDQRSLEKSKRALEIDSGNRIALAAFCYSSYLKGDYKTSIKTEFKIRSELDEEAKQAIFDVFRDEGYITAIETMLFYLEAYASTNYISYTEMGGYYYITGNLDKTIECYLKAYEMHDPMLPYFTLPSYGFDQIKDDPGIISLIKKMNLPLPKSD